MSLKWSLALASGLCSPIAEDERIWLLDYDSAPDFNTDLLASLPLSAVLPDNTPYGKSPSHSYEDGLSSSNQSFYGGNSGPCSPVESKPSRSELASQLLDELKEEPLADWLEEKSELSLFDDFAVPLTSLIEAQPVIHQYVENVAPQTAIPAEEPIDKTQALIREFDCVYGAIQSHLTPPQSPPTVYAQSLDARPATQFLLALQAPYAQPVPYAQPSQQYAWSERDDGDQLAVFDELVRSHASSGHPERPTFQEPPSPGSTTNSSYGSSEGDDEWTLPDEKSTSLPRGGPKASSRSKPYSRNCEDKRSRKKEQNKNAATRYRLKKKAESEVILNEEKGLRDRHSNLNIQCADLQREIKCLKGLMRDLFKAKGMIK